MTDFIIGVVHPENVPAKFAFSLARAIANTGPIQIIECQTSVIDKGRNTIVERFLNESSKDWLLMIDADMTFTAEDIRHLREAANENNPIVSGVAVRPLEGAQGKPVAARRLAGRYEPLTRAECRVARPVDATGAAFLLVNRWVLDEIGTAYKDHARKWFAFTEHDGESFSEDFEFCRRAQELNIPIRLEPIFVGHRKSFTLTLDEEPAL